jgi:hypothetical protein
MMVSDDRMSAMMDRWLFNQRSSTTIMTGAREAQIELTVRWIELNKMDQVESCIACMHASADDEAKKKTFAKMPFLKDDCSPSTEGQSPLCLHQFLLLETTAISSLGTGKSQF